MSNQLTTAMPTKLSETAENIRILSTRTSNNDFGLPLGIYRTDLLPDKALTVDSIIDDDINVAYIPLSYMEGYPTIEGQPFWFILPHETEMAFNCFEIYLQLAEVGARQLFQIPQAIQENGIMLPEHITLTKLQEWYHTYYWQARSRAYDMFMAAHRQRKRLQRAIAMEDDHFIMGERLFGLCVGYLNEKGDELRENMTPKAFTELLKTATQLQRISVGLPGAAPQAADTAQTPQTIEVTMRNIAQKTGIKAEETMNDTSETAKQDKFALLMSDPSALALAQELTVKVNLNSSKPQAFEE